VQGRGIGARLLDLAEDHARSLHLGEVRLYTNEAMTENLSY
jgi:GNAT superfamily N-acetyltransferase